MGFPDSKSIETIERVTGLELDVLNLLHYDVYSFYSQNRKNCEIKMNGLEPEILLKNRPLILNYFIKTGKFNLSSLIKGKLVLDQEETEQFYRELISKKMVDNPDVAYVKSYTNSR